MAFSELRRITADLSLFGSADDAITVPPPVADQGVSLALERRPGNDRTIWFDDGGPKLVVSETITDMTVADGTVAVNLIPSEFLTETFYRLTAGLIVIDFLMPNKDAVLTPALVI